MAHRKPTPEVESKGVCAVAAEEEEKPLIIDRVEEPLLRLSVDMGTMTCNSAFYISLTDEERRALDEGDPSRGLAPMPEFFKARPCEEYFAQAYGFFGRPDISMRQRLVAKRWITEHLRDLEYSLQSVEWDRFPLAWKHYRAIVEEEEVREVVIHGAPSSSSSVAMASAPPADRHDDGDRTKEDRADDDDLLADGFEKL